jgi:hypothetical protein
MIGTNTAVTRGHRPYTVVTAFAAHAIALAALAACADRNTDRVLVNAAADREMEIATAGIVAFLQGKSGLDSAYVADSVVLYVSEEGGGGRVARSSAELADANAWTVQSKGVTYTFLPPGTLTNLTTKSGVHFVCRATTLSSRAPKLADMAHAGALLKGEGENCMQTWNATFVFDTTQATPKLVAAVYDQWEW